jgi:prepilin-type N-terminal cleavage/methylation domain-containing protein
LKRLRKKNGFSLIEIMATIVVISVGLGSFYGVMYRGLQHMKVVGSKNYAVTAAASELEIIRAVSNDKLPESYDGPFMGDVDLSALKDAKGTLKIEDYGDSGGQVKAVTATLTWTVAEKDKSVSLSTLIGNP